MKMKRNRSEEAKKRGRVMRAFELSVEASTAIEAIAEHLSASGRVPGCTLTQAVDLTLRDSAKKIRKKNANGLDTA
jgi:hypothetical protein